MTDDIHNSDAPSIHDIYFDVRKTRTYVRKYAQVNLRTDEDGNPKIA